MLCSASACLSPAEFPPARRRGCSSDRPIHLFDHEHDAFFSAFDDLDAIAGFPDQVRDIDDGQWVGAMHLQPVASNQRLQRFTRLQYRQRAFEPCQVELGHSHASQWRRRYPASTVPHTSSCGASFSRGLHVSLIRACDESATLDGLLCGVPTPIKCK